MTSRPSGCRPSARLALHRAALGASLALALAATSGALAEPSAGDRESARALLEKGDAAMTAGDARGALKFYEGAHALLGLPATGMAVVRAHVALKELVEARDVALSVLQIPQPPNEKAVHVEARKEADKTASDLASRIPSLELELDASASSASIEIDGAAVPRAAAGVPRKVNPGPHQVKVTAPGKKPFSSTIEVAEGEIKKVPVALEAEASGADPDPGPDPKTQPVVPRRDDPPRTSAGVSPLVPVGFAIAGAGLLTGVIAGAVSLSQVSSAKDEHGCTNKACPAAEKKALESDLDPARTTAWVSNVGFIVAGVGAVLGTVGVVVTVTSGSRPAPEAATAPRFAFGVRGASAVFEGSF